MDVMEFWLEYSERSAGTGGKIWWLAPLDGLAWLSGSIPISEAVADYEARNPKLVRQTIGKVPLRVAASCQPLVRNLNAVQLRALLCTEPIYARLITENAPVFVTIPTEPPA
jgi:hypothetical protein